MTKPVYIILAVMLAAGATLISCGQPATEGHGAYAEKSSATDEQPTKHNAADIAFARNMIPHHQQGVELAAMVRNHTLNADLLVIATHIRADQQAEIRTLNLLLAQWHESAAANHGNGGDHGGMPMAGMVDRGAMDRLETLSGADFDTLWAKSMISHHQGAIMMAQNEIDHGLSTDAIHAARLIIEAQQREISRMIHLISATQ